LILFCQRIVFTCKNVYRYQRKEIGDAIFSSVDRDSNYPFITPQRWLKDFEPFTYFTPEVREKLLWRNAQKLLAYTSVKHMNFSSETD
jgi:hypothetical protein